MEDVCSICMDPMEELEQVRLPGCRHLFHVSCMLTAAQYDARCPLCRVLPMGVNVREEGGEETPVQAVLRLDLSEWTRAWRRFTSQRRRVFQRNPSLHEMYRRLRALRVELDAEMNNAQRAFDVRCRDVWRSDVTVLLHRKNVARLRRQEKRLEQRLRAELDPLLGPDPFETL